MEQFKALRAGPQAALQHATLDADQLLRLHREAGRPCVFLLEAASLARLVRAALPGLITPNPPKTKDPRRQLSYYFRRRGGVSALYASYKHAGIVERSLRDLLRTEGLLPGMVGLIGLKEELFNDLGRRALPAAPRPPAVEAMPGYDDEALREILSEHAVFTLADAAARKKYAAIADSYIGSSPRIEWVRRLIWLAAQSSHPVLIQGESGTGKEIVAGQIHACSAVASGPFRSLNCGAIARDLFESELFGHVKGAFTGALFDKDGYFKTAEHGVLFLDEIGDLMPEHQVKLLRVIEEEEYTRVGETESRKSDARIIAATNRDLADLVRLGRFRDDLYYRLFTIRIRTPALREHPEDIPELAQHFWRKLHEKDEKPHRPLAADITDELATYPWPGNARDLRASLMNVAMLTNGRPVTLPLLPAVMHERRGLMPTRLPPAFAPSEKADG